MRGFGAALIEEAIGAEWEEVVPISGSGLSPAPPSPPNLRYFTHLIASPLPATTVHYCHEATAPPTPIKLS